MRLPTRRELIAGPAGNIECAVDEPEGGASRRIALVAHPHPLHGGTLDNKVAQTLARIFADLGYIAVRPNFRGVGASEGTHDHGEGETDDLVAVVEWAQARFGPLPVAAAGFSFGAYVVTRMAARVAVERLVLVGMPHGMVTGGRTYTPGTVPEDTIVIHGENDETAPLANVLEWARPQELPIVLVPGADHFFHRRLHLLRRIVKGQWQK
jgi:alpha/beta superfamily hydrolase